MAALEVLLSGPHDQLGLVKSTGSAALSVVAADERLHIHPRQTMPIAQVLGEHKGAPVPAAALALRAAEAGERGALLERVWWGELRRMGLGALGGGTFAAIKHRLGVIDLYDRWLEASLSLLVQRGRLGRAGDIYTVVPDAPDDGEADWQAWEMRRANWLAHPDLVALVHLEEQCLRALPDVLSGRRRATDVLFPGGSMALVEGVYRNNVVADYFNDGIADLAVALVEARLAQAAAARIRIVEVGAGTGGTSAGVFARLRPYREHIAEYCYTDVSQAFLTHARERYGAAAPYLEARVLDIERPIAGQGFEPGSYDVVIAANVLHATRNIRRSLRNVKALLRCDGVLLLNELSEGSLSQHVTFGLLEGWWRYEDAALRIEGSPALSAQTWRRVLAEEGYGSILLPLTHAHELGQQVVVAASDGVVRQGVQRRSAPKRAPSDSALVAVQAADSPAVSSPASSGSAGDLLDKVQSALIQLVCGQLKVKAEDIDLDSELSEYGFDSISFTQFTNYLNERYRLELTPTIVFEYPTLGKLAHHLVERHGDVLAAQFAPSRIAAPTAAEDYVAEVGRAEPARPQRRGRISRGAVRSERQEPARRDTEAVAVIGMSGSFPMAPDIDAFWRNLMEGRDCISEIPPERWDWREVYGDPAVQAGKTNVKHGGFIAGVDEFDPLFFGISPREAELMDPQQRLLMTHVWKAIEDAGYAAGTLSGSRTAIFAGIGSGEYAAIGAQSRIEIDGYAATGVVPSVGPNRMSYLLNLHGPSEPVETACSSSLVAIHRALQVLADDSCEMAIVGGVNTLLTPDPFVGFSKAGMLSVDGRCKTFAKDANGYARGEGVGILVLKKLSAAEAAGDHIYGVIRGSAENHGGRAQSLTAPNPKAQAEVVKAAFRRAGIGPRTVSYIEAHGTGTPLGDPIEIEGLKSAFRDLSDASRAAASAYCGIGSVKTNVGHLELAAGVAGVIKVLLQLQHRTLVKSLHSEELNPYIQLEGSPFYVVQETRPWEALTDEGGRALPRRAGVSSFGFGGVNAHVVIEEYVGPARPTVTVAPAAIVLSAKNEARLRERAEQLVAAINARLLTDADLGDVAFTLQVGREAMEARLGLLAGSMAEVLRKLQAYLAGEEGIEDFYRGEVKRNKEALTVLAADDDMAQTIEAWVAKGKYGKLLDLWVKGLTFDWRGLYGDRLPRRISLPTYPFARERYWTPAAAAVSPEASKVEAMLDPADTPSAVEEPYKTMLFHEVWEETPPALVADESRTVVCFVSRHDSQEAILAALASRPVNTRVIFVAHGGEPETGTSYQVCREEAASYADALRRIRDEHGAVDAILYMWSFEEPDSLNDYTPIVSMIQAIASSGLSPARLILAGPWDDGVSGCYVESWIGFERSLGLVLPNTAISVVCRAAGGTIGSMGDCFLDLWSELGATGQRSVLYRDGKRFTLKIRESELEAREPVLKPCGVYLITGGMGGLGYAVAERLARKWNARLILVGRSSLNETMQARLDALGAARALYVVADSADVAQMREVVRRAKESFDGVDGVVHAAGVETSQTLLDKTTDSFTRVIRPKISGTLALDAALADTALDFICYFSSLSAILGDFGACDYAVGNRFQTAYGERRPGHLGKVTVINWPLWKDGGMRLGADAAELYLKSSGQRALERDEGLDLFEQLISQPATQHLVIPGRPSRVHCFLGLGAGAVSAPRSVTVTGPGRRPEMKCLNLAQCVEWDLKEIVSRVLKVPREELTIDANLGDFGFDSMSLTEFSISLSRHYGIDVPPTVLFGHGTLEKLTDYLLHRHDDLLEKFYRVPEGAPRAAADAKSAARLATGASQPVSSRRLEGRADSTGPIVREPIAVIGMSGRFPRARNVSELWTILTHGQDVVGPVPEDRGGTWAHASYRAGFIDGAYEFDPLFFEISPREAEHMDPRQRLLLQEAWRALEDAGYGGERIKASRIGTFVGVEEGDYVTPSFDGLATLTGNHNGVLAARLAYFLDFTGPTMAINTACSSGLVAVHQACQSLRTGECDVAIAATVSVMLTPLACRAMDEAGMMSMDGRCYAFDKRANGIVPGEAVVAVVLKRLSQAEVDGDPIHATIRGSGINYDGKTNGITAPSGVSQNRLLRSVYDTYAINPEEIGHVVAHGTGTQLGDPIEVNALHEVFRSYTGNKRYCALTSTKTNFGHCLAASGLVSFTALVQSLRHRTIPISLHCESESDYIDWADSPFYVSKSTTSWTSCDDRRCVGAFCAFGISGTNAHVVMQSYDEANAGEAEQAPFYLFALSAKTERALEEKVAELTAFLERDENRTSDLSRISYTLLDGRHHFAHRVAVVIQDREDALHALKQFGSQEKLPNLFRGVVPRQFSGPKAFQQYGQDLLAQTRSAVENRERYHEILQALADLYCQGYAFDWRGLYGDRLPRRISLPTYPFARERYWVSAAPSGTAPAQVAAGVGALHPLVHRNTSDLWGQRFSSTFRGDEFFLSDHVVGGARVLPGVAYLELARAAVEHSAGEEAAGGVLLKHVVWARPLVAGESGLEVHVALYPEDDGELGYAIYDAVVDEAGEPVIHGQGRAVLAHPGERPVLDVSALAGRCGERVVSGEDCYGAFRGMGLEYGPAHRGLESVAVGHDGSGRPEVLARVVLPGCVAATREQYVLHPSVLDCALQGLIGLSLDAQTGSERTYLPFAVEEVRVWSACADCGWAWVRLSAGGSLADAVRKVDVDVCDEQGAVCVRLSGFSVRAVEREAEATLLWRPEWRAQAAPETEACGYGAHWVVLCAPLQAHAAAIEASLPGVRCIKLESGERGAAERYAAVASAVIGLLREIVQGRPKASVLVQIVSGVEDEAGLFAGLSGALRTAQLENPHIIGQVIGVEAGEAVSGPVAKLRENALGPIDHQVCYRGGERQVLGWSELPSLTGAAPWRDGGVYLITGGAGGLGLIFARAIAASVKAPVLVLTGRSELSAEKQGELEALEELGARLEYRRVDVSDGASVAALVSEICATYGGVSGVVHSAGVIRDSLIVNKSEAEVAAVLSPKVAGLIALDEATRDVALEFMILFGSGSGAFGNVGQADYAAANAFMAAYAVHRNDLVSQGLRRGRTLSIDWPLWRDGGMRVDAATEQAMRSRGVVALDASVGVQALYDAWATGLDQVLVMSGDVRRLRADVMRPSKSVSSRTNSSSSSVTSSASTGSSGDLIERVQRALLHAVSAQLKITVGNIAIDKDLSEYGLDSVGITQLTNHLNERYRLELSPTVVFEHPTPDKLARHLVERHGDVLAAQFAPSRIAAPMAAEDYVAEVGRAEPARPQRRGRISRGAVRSERQEPARRDTEAVAVIGMSGSFPMAPDIDAFWRNLMEGRDCISEIPPERWDWREVYGDPAVQAGKTNVKHGGFIAGVDEFDPLFFGISPREAELMDPQQRLLMTHVWKAIEDAGYAAGTLSGSRTAIFVGMGGEEYGAIIAGSCTESDGYALTGLVPSVGPNRMSYLLNLHGPSEPVETACSSSLVAIHRALQVLTDDSCEMVIVGGVNTLLTPDPFVCFSKAGMLSVDGRCKAFAKDANGYARGEGVGILVLKKLSAAEAAGDHIYGVIRGSAENHGGRAQSLTAPNPKAQAEVVKAAFRRAGIGPRTVSYIEAHGAGTPLGDPIEIEGLKSAFRDLSDASRAAASAYCGIGSVKTNVGHLELAAGVAGVIKVLLQLQHRTLVKSLHR